MNLKIMSLDDLVCCKHDDLYFCFEKQFRTILKESGFARYLHSAVIISGVMLVFGGNTHNDTSLSNGAKCFSADFLAYDIGMYNENYPLE